MPQSNPPPVGDILNSAVPGGCSDTRIELCAEPLPTQADVLADLQAKPATRPTDPAGPIDTIEPTPLPTTRPLTDTSTIPVTGYGNAPASSVPPKSTPTGTFSDNTKQVSMPPLVAALSDDWLTFQRKIDHIEDQVHTLTGSSAKIANEVREMHKLYHNEYASRLRSMQDELERYREIDKGRIFDTILGEVAKLYCDYEPLIQDITDEKGKKRIFYMFEDIAQLLQANGVQRQKSRQGDKRNTRHCQVVERFPTNDPAQHDTVAKSYGTGFYIDNRSLIKEPVDIYLYTENAGDPPVQS